MFQYICIILGEFHSCTVLKLRRFCIIKISLKNNQIKIFVLLLFIKCSLYDFYNITVISSMFMWLYIHLDIPALTLPKHTGNINTGISRCIYSHINILLITVIL